MSHTIPTIIQGRIRGEAGQFEPVISVADTEARVIVSGWEPLVSAASAFKAATTAASQQLTTNAGAARLVNTEISAEQSKTSSEVGAAIAKQNSAEQSKTSSEVGAAIAKQNRETAHGSFLEGHDGEPLLRPLAIESVPERNPDRRPFFEKRPMGRPTCGSLLYFKAGFAAGSNVRQPAPLAPGA